MTERVVEHGRAFKGSQLQTQIYVNERREELEAAIRGALPSIPDMATFSWRSPLAGDRYREYWDDAFLDAIGLSDHVEALRGFWPRGGPHWDALAVVRTSTDGVLLVEGKSHPGELFGGGTAATEATRAHIADAIARTQNWVGIPVEPEPWLGRLYQTANRMAHLYWLREVVGRDAWLIHLLFYGDRGWVEASREELEAAMSAADRELGLQDIELAWAGHACLPAV